MLLLPNGRVGQACESSNIAMLFLTPPQSSVSHCSTGSPFRALLTTSYVSLFLCPSGSTSCIRMRPYGFVSIASVRHVTVRCVLLRKLPSKPTSHYQSSAFYKQLCPSVLFLPFPRTYLCVHVLFFQIA